MDPFSAFDEDITTDNNNNNNNNISNNWYYSKNKQRVGPITYNEIINLYKSNLINEKTRVWNGQDVKEWTKIRDLSLFNNLNPISDLTQSFVETSNNNITSNNNNNLITIGSDSEVIGIINRLRSVGAHLDIDLPTIALCGQQSCGKSSLTESISGVAMPRSSGTCTRCPTELRLIKREGIWECKVGVRYEYDDENLRPLQKVSEQIIGTTSNQSNVTKLVINAQNKLLAQLNLKFTRNVITVEVYSPNCLDLTVVDMPGLIFATEKHSDQKYINLVRSLIEDTIKKQNTLIASVISCKDDMENQLINHLARQYDPNGIRTIGILTKVDTIEHGLEGPWIQILENKKYPLRLGYIAVKNPSQTELNDNITYEIARNNEKLYFKNNNAFNSLPLDIKERLGTKNLIKTLSDTLGNLIINQLPKMSKIIESKIISVQKKILLLPPVPNYGINPTETVFDMLVKFTDESKNLIRMEDTEFWRSVMDEWSKFYDKLDQFKPRYAKSKNSKFLSNLTKSDSVKKCLYTIDEVMNIKKRERTRHYKCARSHFVANSMALWEQETRSTVLACSRVLAQHIQKKISHLFQQFNGLHRLCTSVCHDLIQSLTDDVMKQVLIIYNREKNSEFTLSTGRLHATFQQANDQLSIAFNVNKSNNSNDKEYNKMEAITIMSNSIAYYDLSFRRYVDVVSMSIEDSLFHGFCNKIDGALRNKLNIFKSDAQIEIEKLLQEDPKVAIRRKDYQTQLNRLEQVAKELRLILPIENTIHIFNNNNNINTNNNIDSAYSYNNNNNNNIIKDNKSESGNDEKLIRDNSTTEEVRTQEETKEEEKDNKETKKKKKKRKWFS